MGGSGGGGGALGLYFVEQLELAADFVEAIGFALNLGFNVAAIEAGEHLASADSIEDLDLAGQLDEAAVNVGVDGCLDGVDGAGGGDGAAAAHPEPADEHEGDNQGENRHELIAHPAHQQRQWGWNRRWGFSGVQGLNLRFIGTVEERCPGDAFGFFELREQFAAARGVAQEQAEREIELVGVQVVLAGQL